MARPLGKLFRYRKAPTQAPAGSILMSESFNTQANYSDYVVVQYDASWSHEATGGWDGNGAVKFNLGSGAPSQYCGWQWYNMPVENYQSDTIYYRWCMKWGSSFLNAIGVAGSKTLIVFRSAVGDPPNPRIIIHIHQYNETPAYHQIYSDNNIDTGPPGSPLFTLHDKTGQWVCFEVGMSQSQNFRKFWATVQGGATTLLQNEALNRTDGTWNGSTEFGYFGEVPGGVDANSWWMLDDFVISDAYIGPPAGFGA